MEVNKLTDTRYGKMLYNVNDVCIGRSIELYGEWYQAEMDFMKQFINPGDVCIDVGANIGCHTLFFANAVGERGSVVAFEPQHTLFQVLCANVAINNHLNVNTYNSAVGKQLGLIGVPMLDYSQPGNFGALSVGNNGYSVQLVPLDNFVLPKVNFIKIDVEGFESDVIRGAKKTIQSSRPFIYAENNRKEKSLELINLIKYSKYDVYQHSVKGYSADNFKKSNINIHGDYVEINIFCVPQEKQLTVDLQKL